MAKCYPEAFVDGDFLGVKGKKNSLQGTGCKSARDAARCPTIRFISGGPGRHLRKEQL
jgi:hypothetical protein